MNFKTWILREGNVEPNSLPIMFSFLSPKEQETAKYYIDALNQPQIPNPTYNDLKSFLGRRIEWAYQKFISERFTYGGKYQSLPEPIRSFALNLNYPSPQNIDKIRREVQKMPPAEITNALQQLIAEVGPLLDAIKEAKNKVVKRQPKPVEDRAAVFRPSPVQDVAVIQKLLTQVTEQVYNEYVANVEGWIDRSFQAFLQAIKEERKRFRHGQDQGYVKEPHHFFDDPGMAQMIGQFLIRKDTGYNPHPHKTPGLDYEIKPDYKEIMHRQAEEIATQTRDQFIYKNTKKLGAIVEAKGNLKDAHIVSAKASSQGIEGIMDVSFQDGSSFQVKNQAVWSHSLHGKGFLRFPTTFHKVIMPDGSAMKTPSEEKMNKVFAGKPITPVTPPTEK